MSRLSKCFREPYCAISHFAGSILSLVGMIVLLMITRGSAWNYVAFAIYGTSLVLLYTASGLTHTVFSMTAEDKWERLDFVSIFLLIAGTYTPLCLIALRGPWGWSLLAAEWGLALFGIIAVLTRRTRPKKLTTPLYLIMGWLVVIAFWPLIHSLSLAALIWLLAGGIAYSVGAVIFTMERPNLWPGRFCAHDLWHTLVLTGSGCHFVVMLCFLA